jgi:NAD(P)-dependent dehydrogenase (short-subunit alcohol dehydrogenase family)
MDKFILTGKIVIITVGPGLPGKEFCRNLVEAGAAVVIADIDTHGGNTLATINGRES